MCIRDSLKNIKGRGKVEGCPAVADSDFSTNDNPQYWCNKLKNKQGLVDECVKRELSEDGLYFKTNREIASILIKFDTEP